MIKDSDNRLGKAVQDLRELVVRISVAFYLCLAPPLMRVFWKLRVKSQPEFAEDVELLHAEEALEEASV
jgi:tubulin-specific chaperone A